MSRTRRDLALLTNGVEVWAHGCVMVDGAGRIRRETASAEQWLTRYFEPPPRVGRLPERLWDWVRSQGGGRTDSLPPVRRPLVVGRQGRRVTMRLVSQPPDSVLLLEETATRLNLAVPTRLGLSLRESEVLTWVASGKTNPAIADLLGISSRTVQTHLERIYRKLGVETRTAAAAPGPGGDAGSGPWRARLPLASLRRVGGRRVGGQRVAVGSEPLGQDHGHVHGERRVRVQEPEERGARNPERQDVALGLDRGAPRSSIQDRRLPEELTGSHRSQAHGLLPRLLEPDLGRAVNQAEDGIPRLALPDDYLAGAEAHRLRCLSDGSKRRGRKGCERCDGPQQVDLAFQTFHRPPPLARARCPARVSNSSHPRSILSRRWLFPSL
jgi:DNA-binding CsgD family transcriptional regulator